MKQARLVNSFIAAITMAVLVTSPIYAGTHLNGDGKVRGLENAIAAQERHNNRLLAINGVVGTAVGLSSSGKPAVIILSKSKGIAGLPKTLDGHPVIVKVTGEIFAQKPGQGGGKPTKNAAPTVSITEPQWKFLRAR